MFLWIFSMLFAIERINQLPQNFISQTLESCVMFQTHNDKNYIKLSTEEREYFYYVDFVGSNSYAIPEKLTQKFPDLCANINNENAQKIISFLGKLNKINFLSSFNCEKEYSSWAVFLQGNNTLLDDLNHDRYKITSLNAFKYQNLSEDDKKRFFPQYNFPDVAPEDKVFSLAFCGGEGLFYKVDYQIFPSPMVKVKEENWGDLFAPIDSISHHNLQLSIDQDWFREYDQENIRTGRKIQTIPIQRFLQRDFKIYMHPMKAEDQFELTGQWPVAVENIPDQTNKDWINMRRSTPNSLRNIPMTLQKRFGLSFLKTGKFPRR
jgi:hypothetical protein